MGRDLSMTRPRQIGVGPVATVAVQTCAFFRRVTAGQAHMTGITDTAQIVRHFAPPLDIRTRQIALCRYDRGARELG